MAKNNKEIKSFGKADYANNTGKLSLLSVKSLKNLTIAVEGSDYKIDLPDKWFVVEAKVKFVYVDQKKTDDQYLTCKLIKYDLAKMLIENDSADALNGMQTIDCKFPTNWLPDDLDIVAWLPNRSADDKHSVITLDELAIKPAWVASSFGNGGQYSKLRLEAASFKVVDTL